MEPLIAETACAGDGEGDGGYGGSCAGKDFEYEGFEVTRRVASSA